jgi:hypothetical protein
MENTKVKKKSRLRRFELIINNYNEFEFRSYTKPSTNILQNEIIIFVSN